MKTEEIRMKRNGSQEERGKANWWETGCYPGSTTRIDEPLYITTCQSCRSEFYRIHRAQEVTCPKCGAAFRAGSTTGARNEADGERKGDLQHVRKAG